MSAFLAIIRPGYLGARTTVRARSMFACASVTSAARICASRSASNWSGRNARSSLALANSASLALAFAAASATCGSLRARGLDLSNVFSRLRLAMAAERRASSSSTAAPACARLACATTTALEYAERSSFCNASFASNCASVASARAMSLEGFVLSRVSSTCSG